MKKLSAILAVLSTAACTTHIPIRSELIIEAPADQIYAKLIDFESYPNWNPYHIRVKGKPEVGSALEVRVRRPDGEVIDVPSVHILRMEKDRELTWGGGMKGIFHGEHVFLLEEVGPNQTKLIHNEDFKGIFIGFADLPPDVIEQGYKQMNEALKIEMEKD